MKIVTASPEMEDVPGAVSVQVHVSKVPCGMCYSTIFFGDEGVILRQDQHVVVDSLDAAGATLQPA